MARAGLSPEVVVSLAVDVLDEGGPEALTLAAVAARAGVAAPSLYKHVGGLPELRDLVAARVVVELTAELTAAVVGRSGEDALVALAAAYRGYVVARPARYALVPLDPLHHPVLADAAQQLLAVCLAALRGFGFGADDGVHALRCVRAAVHGFASLEVAGGFGMAPDVDESFDRLVRLLVAGLRAT